MNVQTREQFDYALEAIRASDILVVDTETNTLKVRQQEKMPLISIQIYTPASKESFNFAFRHGYGDLLLSDGTPITNEHYDKTPLNAFTGRDRRTIYWARLWNFWARSKFFGNLPAPYYDELKQVMAERSHEYIFHNANFDLAVMEREGFPTVTRMQDTMVALQMVWGDWGGKRNNDDKDGIEGHFLAINIPEAGGYHAAVERRDVEYIHE